MHASACLKKFFRSRSRELDAPMFGRAGTHKNAACSSFGDILWSILIEKQTQPRVGTITCQSLVNLSSRSV